ncbi:GldL-related protein [Flavobacterium helocola]|jgi:predicted signal transduction protein with EAL and GGDEF domain|uniref:Gliding motility protein GldL-like N-terminal domain-containing protein n=1 Tax=Flavobacterium helocola TaxID=3139139 RepID=A0ABU9I899_9FLAO
MKKQYTVPLVLFLLGMAITIIGALFKIMHWPGANFMLTIGMITEAIALITLIVVLLKNTK